jgi:plasmid stabilization system protein ParE
MSREVIILNAAKADFREIRSHVKARFGEKVWQEVNRELQDTVRDIGSNPKAGKKIEELEDLGQDSFRIRLVRQTRIVYEHDEKEILIHMFIHTRRDFRAHLLKRLFDT